MHSSPLPGLRPLSQQAAWPMVSSWLWAPRSLLAESRAGTVNGTHRHKLAGHLHPQPRGSAPARPPPSHHTRAPSGRPFLCARSARWHQGPCGPGPRPGSGSLCRSHEVTLLLCPLPPPVRIQLPHGAERCGPAPAQPYSVSADPPVLRGWPPPCPRGEKTQLPRLLSAPPSPRPPCAPFLAAHRGAHPGGWAAGLLPPRPA